MVARFMLFLGQKKAIVLTLGDKEIPYETKHSTSEDFVIFVLLLKWRVQRLILLYGVKCRKKREQRKQ